MKKDFSFLKMNSLDLVASKSPFFLFKNRFLDEKEDYGKKYQLGGQDNYFLNLSKGAYRKDDLLTSRTWFFLFKHFLVSQYVFSHLKKGKMFNVLDLGCSRGYLSRILAANSAERRWCSRRASLPGMVPSASCSRAAACTISRSAPSATASRSDIL